MIAVTAPIAEIAMVPVSHGSGRDIACPTGYGSGAGVRHYRPVGAASLAIPSSIRASVKVVFDHSRSCAHKGRPGCLAKGKRRPHAFAPSFESHGQAAYSAEDAKPGAFPLPSRRCRPRRDNPRRSEVRRPPRRYFARREVAGSIRGSSEPLYPVEAVHFVSDHIIARQSGPAETRRFGDLNG